jgi:hypothetical protein
MNIPFPSYVEREREKQALLSAQLGETERRLQVLSTGQDMCPMGSS